VSDSHDVLMVAHQRRQLGETKRGKEKLGERDGGKGWIEHVSLEQRIARTTPY